MASSNLPQPDGAKRFTDCPHCGSLCLGPAILPCGHVTCKRCLSHLLQNKKPCPVCKTSLPVGSEDTVSQLAQRFSSELVLHDLVNERLYDLGQQSCEVCQNRDATMICQDCGEMYCDGCASAHRKMRATKEHVQQSLPHTLHNTSEVNRPQTRTRRRPHSTSSIIYGDSITNLPRAPTKTGELDRQWIELQVQMFEKATHDVQKVGQAAHSFITFAQGLADEAKEKEKILNIYTNRLANAETRKDNDGHVCVNGLSDDDVTTTVKSQDLLPRLRDVRERCGQFDVMEMLQTELSGLVTGDKAVLEEQMAGAVKEAEELRVNLLEAQKARLEAHLELMDLRRRIKMIDSKHSKLETEVADLRLRVAQDEKREEEAKRTHFDLNQKVVKAESSREALSKELANLQDKMAELIKDATTKENDSRLALDDSPRPERKVDDQLASAEREGDEALSKVHRVTTELEDMDTDKTVKVLQTKLGDAERGDSSTMSGCSVNVTLNFVEDETPNSTCLGLPVGYGSITGPSTGGKETWIGNCSICRSVGACSCDTDSSDDSMTSKRNACAMYCVNDLPDNNPSTRRWSTEDDSTFLGPLINGLKDESDRIQKKTFTHWMNSFLCERKPPIKVENLFEEIKDGTVLLSLLEALSGDKLTMEKGANQCRPHHIANITTALKYLETKHIKLVNINATSIADGKPAIVLGLVWTIILYFQIEDTISQVPNIPDMEEEGPSNKKKQALPKQSLLAWAKRILVKKYGIIIKNFDKCWKDGVAFNAMIHNIRPDLVDMDVVRHQQARINLEHAFSTAEDKLGIARLLDPEDVDVDRPDEKSIMTYVAQFLKAYPDAGDPNAGLPTDASPRGSQDPHFVCLEGPRTSSSEC